MHEILSLIAQYGSAVAFVIAFLEQIGAPVPAIPVLMVAGAVARNSGGDVGVLFVLAVLGATLADVIWFFLGRKFGYRVMGFICRVSLSPDSCVRKTEDFFDRWGLRSLVFSKFVPGFSLIAPPLAGALPAFRFRQFIVFDLAGSIVWAASALAAGVVFHTAIGSILDRLAALGNWALIILGALLLLFLAFKWYDRRRFYRRLRLARMPVEELRERIENGTPIVILDVRSATAQTRDPRRIPGALLVQPEQLEERLRDIAPDEEIALYCT